MTVGWRYDHSLRYEPDNGPADPVPNGTTKDRAAALYRLIDGLTAGGIDGDQAPQFAADMYRNLR